MFRYASLLAAVAALFLVGTSEAKGRPGGGRSSGSAVGKSAGRGFQKESGRRSASRGFRGRVGYRGYGYRGRYGLYRGADYRGWSRYYYSPYWRATFYYAPVDATWYYWYAPDRVYLPSSQLTVRPPVGAAVVPGIEVPAATGRDVPTLPMPPAR